MKTKAIAVAGAVVLSALFGMNVAAYAGQERPAEKQDHAKPQQGGSHEQARPAQQQRTQPQQARPQQRQDRSQGPAAQPQQRQAQDRQKQNRVQQQQQQTRNPQLRPAGGQQRQQPPQQARGNGNSRQRTPDQRRFEQSAWQQHSAANWHSDHRNWQQRGGYNGYRIPDNRYRGYFGRGHGFRIGGLPFLVVGGYPRFQYEGYWFSMIDPYPGYWTANWYDTDDVYVDYVDNGYYLYNRRYPGVGIAISISM